MIAAEELYDHFMNMLVLFSESLVFIKAVKEWRFLEYRYDTEADTDCLCSHKHLMHVFMYRNVENGNVINVGSECVKHFDYQVSVLALFKFIKGDVKKIPMVGMELAHEDGVVNDWELKFYNNVSARRKLSMKQIAKMNYIESKVKLRYMACF